MLSSRIPFFDLKRQYVTLRRDIDSALRAVFEKTAFSGGEFVDIFERQFAKYCGTKYVSGLNSGSSALHLALLSVGIQPGDEVIVPAHTFIASAASVSYIGAKPVFVDCLAETWEIDPMSVETAITKKTKAILAVHLYGVPCDIGTLKKIAKKFKLFLIEDCAQAHGALYEGRKVGTFGDIGCFSFYPSKNLGAYGEGGAIVTNNKRYFEIIVALRSHGEKEKYFHEIVGFNMRMDGIQAAVLSVKLPHLTKWNNRKTQIVAAYRRGITNPRIKLQTIPINVTPAFHLFVVTARDRNKFVKHMRMQGIDTAFHYPTPCHLQKAYAFLGYKKGDLPNTEYVASHCVSLPLFPELTEKEVRRVIDAVNTYA